MAITPIKALLFLVGGSAAESHPDQFEPVAAMAGDPRGEAPVALLPEVAPDVREREIAFGPGGRQFVIAELRNRLGRRSVPDVPTAQGPIMPTMSHGPPGPRPSK